LTAIHDASFFNGIAERLGFPLRDETRGNELNKGSKLQAVHPVIRTNRMYSFNQVEVLRKADRTIAVTGWKAVFVNKAFTKRIVELTKDESDVILGYLFNVCASSFLSFYFYASRPGNH
jgi:alpha-ketoglutarate-dependent taurine dioxygenase